MTLEETLQDFIIVTKERFLETEKSLKETEKLLSEKFQDTDKKLRKLEGLFTSQWGKLVEAMVQPAALKLFQDRGIEVNRAMQRVVVRKGDLQKEFDIVLVNGDTVVVVEVKSTLKVEDVKYHIECLKRFYDYLPEYTGKKVFGAVAYISCDEKSDLFAFKNGLFVITLTGEDLIEIKNKTDFNPKNFIEA